jgi:hypothetical protein
LYDIIFLVSLAAAALAACLTPIFTIIKSVETYRDVNRDRAVYIFKALLAMAAWGVLTCGMLFMLFAHVYGMAHRVNREVPPDWRAALILLALAGVYGLAGVGLVYWMSCKEEIQ